MGCGGSVQSNATSNSNSSTSQPEVETTRRRLSVGQGDKSVTEEVNAAVEADRGEVQELDEASIMQLVKEGGGRRFSIGSADDTGKKSFADKKKKEEGDKISTGFGYTCRKGLKPESPNQDSWMILQLPDTANIKGIRMYGVFDGHGSKGHDISFYVKENLPKILLKDQAFDSKLYKDALSNGFRKIQGFISTASELNKLDAKLSGTTATVAVHNTLENKITLAHVADSTAVVGTWSGEKLKGRALTRDHKPDLEDERARIEKAGGRVIFDGYANHRVYAKNERYPGLNMSRCLGDLLAHKNCGVTCEPEVTEYQIQAEDHILLLCSDGVWEFITPDEACNLVQKFDITKAGDAADRLAKEAWDRWIREEGGCVVDDITVVLVYLHAEKKEGA